jgi:hypothetical protein
MKLFSFLSLFLLSTLLPAQHIVKLENPSFEDYPRQGSAPEGWGSCDFEGTTPPDIHPSDDYPFFEVTKSPHHGYTYLGMVVRDNDTWESVAQKLSEPLKADHVYEFRIRLAKSERYVSTSLKTGNTANYTTPAVLRVWAGYSYCEPVEMLAETAPVDHAEWLEYRITFQPKAPYTHLMLEAYFDILVEYPYNGHLLLDYGSNLVGFPNDIPNLEDMDIEQLDAYIQENGAKLRQLAEERGQTLPVEALLVYQLAKFEKDLGTSGVQSYIANTNFSEVTKTIRMLGGIGFTDPLHLLQEAVRIYRSPSDERTPEELAFWEEIDGHYADALQREPLTEKRKAYLEDNRENIVQQIKTVLEETN